MEREKIIVYSIDHLSKGDHKQPELLVERFGPYLKRQPLSLHSPHRHSFYHLVMFTRGMGTHMIDFTQFPVEPFQIYFMAPGQVHSWQFEGEIEGYVVHFSDSIFSSFVLDASFLERFFFFCGIAEDCVCQLPPEVQPKATQLFEEMLEQTTAGNKEDEIAMTRLLLIQLFLLVEKASTIRRINEQLHHKQVTLKKFRQLIELHYREWRLPKEYADVLFVTPSYLNTLCQELLSKTAGELIRDRVLLEAKRLLINTRNMPVAKIASDLNFQDKSYFNRFFKKYTHSTPDEFRKQV